MGIHLSITSTVLPLFTMLFQKFVVSLTQFIYYRTDHNSNIIVLNYIVGGSIVGGTNVGGSIVGGSIVGGSIVGGKLSGGKLSGGQLSPTR